jgi:hypothetical protein
MGYRGTADARADDGAAPGLRPCGAQRLSASAHRPSRVKNPLGTSVLAKTQTGQSLAGFGVSVRG